MGRFSKEIKTKNKREKSLDLCVIIPPPPPNFATQIRTKQFK